MSTRQHVVAVVVVAILGIWGTPGWGNTLTLQNGLNGYSGVADTYLNGYAGGAWNQTRNYGASTDLRVMGAALADGGLRTGTLIRFDNLFGPGSNQIPAAGVTITKATLRLYCTAEPEGDAAYTTDTFLMKTPWIEGNKNGAYATGGEVTYFYLGFEDNGGHVIAYWGNQSQAEKGPVPGIDYDGNMNVWKGGADIAVNTWSDFDITPYVEAWQTGTPNYGVYITEISSWWNGAIFVSSNGDAAYRPQLVVEYVPEPASLALLAVGGLFPRRRK